MRNPHTGSGFIPVDRTAGGVDFGDWVEADYALEQAQDHGNFKPLIERLRRATYLFPEERALAADKLDGIWKAPAHRIKKHPDIYAGRDFYLALCFLKLRAEGISHKEAIYQMTTDESLKGVSDSTIRKAIRKNEALFGSLLRRRSGKEA